MAADPTDDDVSLTREERERIDGMYIKLANASLYEMLGVRADADRKAIRDAYFALSQRFHPDAYYGQNLGAWKPRVEHIFRELSRAYDVLGNPRQRAEYDAFLSAQELTNQVSADMLPPAPWMGEAPSRHPPAPRPQPARGAGGDGGRPPAPQPTAVSAPPPPGPSLTAPARAPREGVTLSPPRVPVITEPPPSVPPRPSHVTSPAPAARGAAQHDAASASHSGTVSRAVPPGAAPPARPSLTVPITHPSGAPAGSIQIDAEAAQRAAREALARKLLGGRAPSASAVAARTRSQAAPPHVPTTAPPPPGRTTSAPAWAPSVPPAAPSVPGGVSAPPPPSYNTPSPPPRHTPAPPNRAVSAPPQQPPAFSSRPPGPPSGASRPPFHPSPVPPAGGSSPGMTALQGLHAARTAQADAHRQARVRALLQAAEEAVGLNDLIAASDALTAARTLAPEDLAIRARADEVAQKLAASLANKFVEQARYEERTGNWYDAAQSWQKAWLGRNDDFMLLVRAAHALLRADKELPKAADLARRAVMMAPGNLDAHIVLARIFIAGRLRESAIATLEAAAKLDPSSQVVKDLLKRARNG